MVALCFTGGINSARAAGLRQPAPRRSTAGVVLPSAATKRGFFVSGLLGRKNLDCFGIVAALLRCKNRRRVLFARLLRLQGKNGRGSPVQDRAIPLSVG